MQSSTAKKGVTYQNRALGYLFSLYDDKPFHFSGEWHLVWVYAQPAEYGYITRYHKAVK